MQLSQIIKEVRCSFSRLEKWSNKNPNGRFFKGQFDSWKQALAIVILLNAIACNSSKKTNNNDENSNESKLIIVSYGINLDSLNTTLIKGRIVDSEGEPLIGADVKIDEVSSGILADLDGNFELEFLNKNLKKKIISVQYVGFESFRFKLTEVKNKEVKIVMFDDTVIGGELVGLRPSFWKRVWTRIKKIFR